MISAWFAHLPQGEAQSKFKQAVAAQNESAVTQRLRELLEQHVKRVTEEAVSFDDPNWTVKRAAQDGEMKAFLQVLKLIERGN